MKRVFLIFSLLLLFVSCMERGVNNEYKVILVEKFHLHNGIEKLQFQKLFNNKYQILLNIVGNTDSIVYKYDSIKGYSISFEYLKRNLNEKNKFVLSYIDTIYASDIISNAIIRERNKMFSDTFNVFNYYLDRVYYDYRNNIKIDSFKSDSGLVYKYNYKIGKIVLLSIAPYINVFDYSSGEKIDSVNLYCINKKLIKEEYFFKNQHVIKDNYYDKNRVVKTILYSIKSNGMRENDFIDVFKYTVLDNYKGFEFKEPQINK